VLELRERPRAHSRLYTDSARTGRAECPGQRRSARALQGAFPGAGDPVDDLSGAVGVARLGVEELDEHGVSQSLGVGF
jgi:hypothetical protein